MALWLYSDRMDFAIFGLPYQIDFGVLAGLLVPLEVCSNQIKTMPVV